MDQNKKISLPESIVMIMLCGFADIFEILISILSFVPILTGIALALNWVIDWFVFLIIEFWFIMKGELGPWFIGGSITEMIPYIDILPLRTASCIFAIWKVNNPSSLPIPLSPKNIIKPKA